MKKGDIFIIKLDAGRGHEQFGERPAVLISDSKTGILIVLPLTSNLEALRFPHTLTILPDKFNNLDAESVILAFHIKAVDKSRIIKQIGRLDTKLLKKIDLILKEMLNL